MSDYKTSILPPPAQLLLKSVEERLTEYVAKMAPGKPINAQDGAFQQRQMWQGVILPLLQQRPEVFIAGWGLLLATINEHRKGAFSPAYINRFREDIRLSITDRRNMERLLHLATMTCDPKARVLAMRQLDMNRILAQLPSEDMRQNVIAFYEL